MKTQQDGDQRHGADHFTRKGVSQSPAMKLRPPPHPLYLFLNYGEYRKWASSKVILRLPLFLPRRFKRRMYRRIEKHQGFARRVAQHREALLAQLTVSAREIFYELEALYISPSQTRQKNK